jgi:hypothetical protein
VRTADTKAKWEGVKEKWGTSGLVLTITAAFLAVFLFSSYLVLTLLNGIHGWLTFHVTDLVTPILNVIVWIFPSALITAFWWLITWILINGLMAVYKNLRALF